MAKSDTTSGFEAWWELLPDETKTGINRRLAWMAFAAGCRYRSNPPKNIYHFRAGRWKVTVTADSLEDARAKAAEKLDQRAEKLGAKAPPSGWPLTKVAGSA